MHSSHFAIVLMGISLTSANVMNSKCLRSHIIDERKCTKYRGPIIPVEDLMETIYRSITELFGNDNGNTGDEYIKVEALLLDIMTFILENVQFPALDDLNLHHKNLLRNAGENILNNHLTNRDSQNKNSPITTKADPKNNKPSYKENIAARNEDLDLYIMDRIKKNGYPVEKHEITTSDGYILDIFRIPGKGPVVFLMHPLEGSSNDWVTAEWDRGLAYLISNAGFDVWMGNSRGNTHGSKHVSLSPECTEFWDYCWHEIGTIDVPEMIDYILEETNQKTLKYIGHSQGTTTFFVMCSERPEYNKKISLMVALAPVAWWGHANGPVWQLLGVLSKELAVITTLGGNFPIFARNATSNVLWRQLCNTPNSAALFCNNLNFVLNGFDYSQVNSTYLPSFYAHIPSGASSKQYVHYAQVTKSKTFRQYDYGLEKNLLRYGTEFPPDYPVEKITAPIAMFHADNDWVSNIKDVEILANKLPNVISINRVPLDTFNHGDYFLANDVKSLLYDKVLDILTK